MENKLIIFSNSIQNTIKNTTKIAKMEKPKKIRVLIENQHFEESDYLPEIQWKLLSEMDMDCDILGEHLSNTSIMPTILKHMHLKLTSYKTQDQKHHFLNSNDFVDIKYVLELLKKNEMKCFYCRELVQLLYRHVREPKQWTLERINNDIGHNKGNVTIACLNCNLRRRCMQQERYIFTKQLRITKMDSDT